MDGDAGNDRFILAANNGDATGDEVTGDTGIDRADYSACGSSDPVVVSIDNTNNDGPSSGDCGSGSIASDDVHTDVESITGSPQGDTLTGFCTANTILGDPDVTGATFTGGVDTINGDPAICGPPGHGGDFLGGGAGADEIDGDGTTGTLGFDTVTYGVPYTSTGAINITIDGSNNDTDGTGALTEDVHTDIDRVIGGAGGDIINAAGALGGWGGVATNGVTIFGRAGVDVITGSANNDTLDAEAGTGQSINGGAGTDSCLATGGTFAGGQPTNCSP